MSLDAEDLWFEFDRDGDLIVHSNSENYLVLC